MLHDRYNAGNGLTWDDLNELGRERFLGDARAALAAADATQGEILGYRVVYLDAEYFYHAKDMVLVRRSKLAAGAGIPGAETKLSGNDERRYS